MFDRIQNRIASMSKITRVMIAGAVVAGTLGAGSMAMAKGPHKMNQEKWESMSQEEKQEVMNKRLDRRMNKMTEKLELTDAQVPKVRAVFEASQAKRLEIMEKHKGDREAARPEMKALKQNPRAQLDAILTPEQVQTLEQMKKDHKGKRGKHGKRGEKRLERMSAELNLSADQEAQIKTIMQDAGQERKQIIELVGSREEAKPELRELHIRTDAKIKEVLNDEQDARFDELKAERKARRGERRGKRG